MTEAEYVERLKISAQSYLDFILGKISGDAARDAVFRWDHMKTNLSAHTIIEMCDAWIDQNEVK